MIALNATFFTVAVQAETEGADLAYPGIYDPTVGGAIFTALYETLMNTPFGSPLWNSLSNMAEQINRYWGSMSREGDGHGFGSPWYATYNLGSSTPPTKETTTYKCDAKLGRPQHVDCSQLQYSQLYHETDDSLALQPGFTKFFHSQTCNIGISMLVSTTVTWKQIKSAVNEIIEVCVNNPLKSATGGSSFLRTSEPVQHRNCWEKKETRHRLLECVATGCEHHSLPAVRELSDASNGQRRNGELHLDECSAQSRCTTLPEHSPSSAPVKTLAG